MRAIRIESSGTEYEEPVSDARDQEAIWIMASRQHPRSFEPLYERYATQIYRYCYRQTENEEVANDLTAQVFVRALAKLDRRSRVMDA